MLSDDSLNVLMQPIIERQENINNYVLKKIAQRVKQIGTMSSSDLHKLQRLYETGSDVREINKQLASLTLLQELEIKKIIEIVAKQAYIDVKPYYDYRHKSYLPFKQNKPLQRVVKTVQRQTVNTYHNMSKAQAFMLRDKTNPKILKPTKIAKTYQKIIDEAIQAAQSGTIDYQSAMRRSLKQLNESGIRYVEYHPESGRTFSQRLDTAVKRNLLDGIRAINQGVQDVTGEQYGATGKEISVHQYPAPDHEPIQGHQFTNEEWEKLQSVQPFSDVNGNKFDAIERHIGVLNCRHFAWSVIAGVTKPNYTQEQLDHIIERNHNGYTDKSGKHYTMYECTQEQRRLETLVRKNKDGQIMAREAGDDTLAKEYQTKINRYTQQYEAFSKACGLNTVKKNLTVSGYRKIGV